MTTVPSAKIHSVAGQSRASIVARAIWCKLGHHRWGSPRFYKSRPSSAYRQCAACPKWKDVRW